MKIAKRFDENSRTVVLKRAIQNNQFYEWFCLWITQTAGYVLK